MMSCFKMVPACAWFDSDARDSDCVIAMSRNRHNLDISAVCVAKKHIQDLTG